MPLMAWLKEFFRCVDEISRSLKDEHIGVIEALGSCISYAPSVAEKL
jgi:hypothetical protein